ncbi:MAG: hypothetical protein QM770_09210 [Tepidisphaeraceae bacterium]
MVSGVNSSSSSSTMAQLQKLMRQRGTNRPGGDGDGKRPELPSGFQSILDSAMQSGGTSDQIKSTISEKYAEYQKTDEYKNLSSEQQSKLTEMVEKGPPSGPPPSGGMGGPPPTGASGSSSDSSGDSSDSTSQAEVIKALFAKLEEMGQSTRSKLAQQTSSSEAA